MLTESQFRILNYLVENSDSTPSQREIAAKTDISLGKVNSIIKELSDNSLIDKSLKVTDNGFTALEPHKVKNAVIMAAGMSSRFAPLSYEMPKALLRVKGELLIEREINQLHEAGINDITIVVGYMKEKLFYLEEKYGVKIIINTEYQKYNNTSTLMLVRHLLDNTYICSSDNYFEFNPFEKYVYKAYYSAMYAPGETDEYCLNYNNKSRITAVTVGGSSAWYMIGHAYYDREFSNKFVSILTDDYKNPASKLCLWEDIYSQHIKELDMNIRKYKYGIQEFDSLDELREFDGKYVENTDSYIFDNICSVLGCEDKDVMHIIPIKTGLTNLSFKFECFGKKYVYRHPGKGTNEYINRKNEAEIMQIAKRLGLDNTFIHIDCEKGWKISDFIDNVRTLDYHNPEHIEKSMDMLRTLHNSGEKVDGKFDIWQKILEFADKTKSDSQDDFSDLSELFSRMNELHIYLSEDKFQTCLCHCDSYDPNFLLDEDNNMYLIDWEYSGMSDPGTDIGTFIACSDYTVDEAKQVIKTYLAHEPTDKEIRHYLGYVAMAAYFWFLWALFQEKNANPVGEYLYTWYKYSKQYAKLALEMYKK